MASVKDDPNVIAFMALFQRLKSDLGEPDGLQQLAAKDEGVRKLCLDLDLAATLLTMRERSHPQLFAAPVDPKFIQAWREYEQQYASVLAGVALMDMANVGPEALPKPLSHHDQFLL